MFAIIRVGGKQYRVENGTQILVDRLHVEPGGAVEGVEVLMVVDGDDTKIGAPVVEGVAVGVTAVRHHLGKKIRVFKYKAKKNYRRRIGSRPHQTLIRVDSIGGNSTRANTRAAAPASKSAPVEVAPIVTETVAPVETQAVAPTETTEVPTTEVVQAVVETSSEASTVAAIEEVPGVESVEVVEGSEKSA